MKTHALRLAALLLVVASSPTALAQEPPLAPAPTPSRPPPAPETATVECPRCHPGHWWEEPTRPFISLRLDAGYLYLKPRFSFGYGKPFTFWGGLDVAPLVTPDAAGGYSGLRLQVDWFEIRAGARYEHAFLRQFLSPKSSYDLIDLSEFTNHPSGYFDLEAEVGAAIPAGPGNVLVTGTVESIQGVTSGYYVFDETLHVVVNPPWVYRGRLGYAVRFLPEKNAQVGVVGEVIDIPNRQDQVYRAGFIATFDVDDHLQAIATVLAPIVTPDSLGLLGADYTELGIRYRWATEHTHIPQELIPSGDTASAR